MWAKEGTVPDTPSDGYGPPAGAGYPGAPRPAGPPPNYPPGPVFGRPPEQPAITPPSWWEERRERRLRQRRPSTWRGTLVKLAILLVAVWLVLRSCDDKPNLLDVRPAPPPGPITSVPGGPVVSTSAADPSEVPAEELTQRARTAAMDAASYRLRGDVDLTSTGPITLDLTLAEDRTDGRVTKDGATIEVQRRGLAVQSRVPGGRWVEGDIAELPNGDSIGLRPLLDAGHWITELIPTPEASTASPKTEQQGGRTVTRIRLRGGSHLYVSATGTPYPVKLTRPDAKYPNLTFDSWR
jgi:hypothetical protein